MSFQTDIEAYTGSIANYTSEANLWMVEGVKEVVALASKLNPSLMPLFAVSTSFGASTYTYTLSDTEKVLNVYLNDGTNDYECNLIPITLKRYAGTSGSIHKAIVTAPVYYLENGSINVLPESGTAKANIVAFGESVNVANDTGLGDSVVNLAGVTTDAPTAGTAVSFTSNAHGLSNGDRVKLSGFTQSYFNGIVSEVESGTANAFELEGIVGNGSINTDSGNVQSVVGGFPSGFYILPILYTANNVLARKMLDHNIPSDVTLPVVPSVPATPSFTYNDAVVNDIVWSSLDITDMAALTASAPTFTAPVMPALDYTKVNEYIDTEEDTELASAKIQEVATQINEYSSQIQTAVQSFNQENTVYQEDVQRKMQNFQKDIQEAVQNIQTELQSKMANLSKDQQIEIQNSINNFQKDVQEYQSEMGRYQAQVGTYGAEVNAAMQEFSSNINKRNMQYQWLQGQLAYVKGLYQSKIQSLIGGSA